MRVVFLVIVANEIEELELTAVFGSDSPVEECTEGVTLHEAVEQPAYLSGSPHELPLDGRQHKVVLLDFIKRLSNGVSGLIHGVPPSLLDSLPVADSNDCYPFDEEH